MASGNEIGKARLSNEQMLDQFGKLATLGVIEYIVPSAPVGERWVVGYKGQVANMSGTEATCFLLGVSATTDFAVQHLGLDIEVSKAHDL